MSDNIQENDMEGILSSIKDILEEDEKQQQINISADTSGAENILDEVLNSTEVDDILELSPEMRVDNNIEENIVADDVLINVDDLLADKNNQPIEAITDETSLTDAVSDSSVAEIDALIQNESPIDDIIASNEPFFEPAVVEETVPADEPFFETSDNASIDTLLEDAPAVEQIPEVFDVRNEIEEVSIDNLLGTEEPVAVEEVAPVFEEPVAVEEVAPVYEEPVAVEEVAPVYEEPVAVEEVVPVYEEPVAVEEVAPVYEEPTMIEEVAVYEPVIEIEPVEEDVVAEENQDASSNIMSNFAKMFSHEERTDDVSVTEAGNTSKTLEDLVVDAIQKAIGKEILAKWNNGTDFNGFVEAEIRHQVETWITNNMNDVIENIVKKEVERVIAKVSS